MTAPCSTFTPRSARDVTNCACGWSHAAHQRHLFARGNTSKACALFEPLPGEYGEHCAVCHWTHENHGTQVDKPWRPPYIDASYETVHGSTAAPLRFSRTVRVF